LRPGRQAAESSYSESMRGAADLIERLQRSQHQYEDSIQALVAVSQTLSRQLAEGQAAGGHEQVELLMRIGELQQQSTAETRELLSQVVRLLQEGFRLHA